MKFRIKKENDLYCAEYKKGMFWWYVGGSASRDIEKTREECRKFAKSFKKSEIVEEFEL